VVAVQTKDGRPLVWGFWDAKSPIAVRVLDGARIDDARALVRGRLEAALARRLERLDPARTNAFRWVHGEGDRLPGIHVDLYDDVAAVRYDGGGARAFYQDLPALLVAAGERAGVRQVVDREQRSQVGERQVRENGLLFAVDLARGQKGGLFLDQRENRAEVGRRARGKTVLNLFGYTGGFSLYAAAGGALRTDTVDAAAPPWRPPAATSSATAWTSARPASTPATPSPSSRRPAAEAALGHRHLRSPQLRPSKKALPAARAAYRACTPSPRRGGPRRPLLPGLLLQPLRPPGVPGQREGWTCARGRTALGSCGGA
jgi:23S rRNA (cytosine1962-C5)-methyltransferase